MTLTAMEPDRADGSCATVCEHVTVRAGGCWVCGVEGSEAVGEH